MNEILITDELKEIKEKRPLVHCITNYVTANDCANIILAVGGIPVMADNKYEVEEISSKAQALVINIGTLSQGRLEAIILAGKSANANNVPIIFDPVGIAASSSRKESALSILKEVKVSVIRGNIAEMKVLLGMKAVSKGVDSIEEVDKNSSEEIAIDIADKLGVVAVITGQTDCISDGKRICSVQNGVELMTRITGAGCMTTSLIGTFLGVTTDSFLASLMGVLTMGVAGEAAFENLKEKEGNGSFRVRLIDAVNLMTIEQLKERGRISG